MNLSPNFSLAELTKSQTALRRGIDNTPPDKAVVQLALLCREILEPVRNHFAPFSPSSGYRSHELNEAVGSKPTSQHVLGQAVDFEIPRFENIKIAHWIQQNLKFDQLILEFYDGTPSGGWVHCSYVPAGRGEVLTISKSGVTKGLPCGDSL